MKKFKFLWSILVDSAIALILLVLLRLIETEVICQAIRRILRCSSDMRMFMAVFFLGLSVILAIYRAAVHRWAIILPFSVIAYIFCLLFHKDIGSGEIGWLSIACLFAIAFFHALVISRTGTGEL